MSGGIVAVTGATGRLGGRVARRLSDRGVAARLVVRDPARAPRLPHTHAAPAAYSDGRAMRRALDGVATLFLVSATEGLNRTVEHRQAVDAAAEAGVRHLVYLSFIAASPNSTFTLGRDHWDTEQYIRDSGVRFTFVRDNMYADFLPQLVGDDGVVRGPAADGRIGAVALDDVADAVTAILLDPARHAEATYGLTGPEALDLAHIAELLTGSTGRRITYEPETPAQAYTSRAAYGAEPWQVDAWVSTYQAIARGEFAVVTDDVHRLTGRPPRSIADVLTSGAEDL